MTINVQIRSQHDVAEMGMAGFETTVACDSWTDAIDHIHRIVHHHGEDGEWTKGLVAILIFPHIVVNGEDLSG